MVPFQSHVLGACLSDSGIEVLDSVETLDSRNESFRYRTRTDPFVFGNPSFYISVSSSGVATSASQFLSYLLFSSLCGALLYLCSLNLQVHESPLNLCFLELQAFQQQELEKLQAASYPDFMDDDALSDIRGVVSSGKGGPVARASQLWNGILSHSGLTVLSCQKT